MILLFKINIGDIDLKSLIYNKDLFDISNNEKWVGSDKYHMAVTHLPCRHDLLQTSGTSGMLPV